MEETTPPSGSVPHAFGNALARRWAPDLPRPLTGGFLCLLYALRTLASADGALRYERDRKGIPITQIAKACRSNEKDTRRYITAAIAAGVVGTIGETGRGRATVYVLLLAPSPNWAAAVAVLSTSRPKPGQEPAPWQEPEVQHERSSGHRDPMSGTSGSGHRDPNPTGTTSGHRDPMEFGSPRPVEFGSPRPDHPGSTHVLPHEMAEVVPQPRDARGHEDQSTPAGLDGPAPPALRPLPTLPPGSHRGRGRQVPAGQSPLLMSVPCEPVPVRQDLTRAERDELRAQATPDDVRRAIAEHGISQAALLYGWQLITPHLPATTGT